MRTINLGNGGVWEAILENAVEVQPHGKGRFIYVDIEAINNVPAVMVPTGRPDAKSKLDELYKHLICHVDPYCQKDQNTGRSVISKIEIHATNAADLDAIVQDPVNAVPTILASAGEPDKDKRMKKSYSRRHPDVPNVPTQQRQVTLEGKTYVLNT